MKQDVFITHEGQTYNATVIAAQPFEDFQRDALQQAKDAEHPTLHYGAWGDQQGAKLREAWDAAVAKVKPTEPAKVEVSKETFDSAISNNLEEKVSEANANNGKGKK